MIRRQIHPWIGFCLLASVVITVSTTNAVARDFFGNNYALVVGINRYEASATWPRVGYGEKDALAIADFMMGQGYEVTLLLGKEATRENILSALSDEIAPKLTGHDRVMMYFSGHGETREVGWRDFGYIIPYDGTDRFPTWISMAEMREMSSQLLKARHQLFVFDSCYGGSIGQKQSDINQRRYPPRYIEKISSNRARQFITAGGKNEQVLAEGPFGYSYFTGYLLEALDGKADRDGDTYITMSELSAFLLHGASNWDHTPRWGVLPEHEQGEFWFRVPGSEDERQDIALDPPETDYSSPWIFKSRPTIELKEPLLLSHPQGPIDNFTLIPGIDTEIQAELYEIGIFHYWQISEWNRGNVEWIREKTFKIRKTVERAWAHDAVKLAN